MYKDPALPNVSNFVSSALQLRAFEQQSIMQALEWDSNMQAHLMKNKWHSTYLLHDTYITQIQ
jgi:hypothetical protein